MNMNSMLEVLTKLSDTGIAIIGIIVAIFAIVGGEFNFKVHQMNLRFARNQESFC